MKGWGIDPWSRHRKTSFSRQNATLSLIPESPSFSYGEYVKICLIYGKRLATLIVIKRNMIQPLSIIIFNKSDSIPDEKLKEARDKSLKSADENLHNLLEEYV